MLARDRKIEINAPCLYMEYDSDRKRWEQKPPAVDCGFSCESCGWNPKERERRMKEGGWVYDANGVRHLLFNANVPVSQPT